MKNIFAAIVTIIMLGIIFISGMPPKDYTFKLTDAQVQLLWQVMDQSTAPHLQVKEIQAVIQSQYQAQIDTTQKK